MSREADRGKRGFLHGSARRESVARTDGRSDALCDLAMNAVCLTQDSVPSPEASPMVTATETPSARVFAITVPRTHGAASHRTGSLDARRRAWGEAVPCGSLHRILDCPVSVLWHLQALVGRIVKFLVARPPSAPMPRRRRLLYVTTRSGAAAEDYSSGERLASLVWTLMRVSKSFSDCPELVAAAVAVRAWLMI